MSLDSFAQEIQDRTRREIRQLDSMLAEKKASNDAKRDSSIAKLQAQYTTEAKVRSEREAARIVEEARLQAKKILFDAINSNLESSLDEIKQVLGGFTQKPEYKNLLLRMIEYAKSKLGGEVVVHCRGEDKALLSKDQRSGVTIGSTIKTIGGTVIEDKKGTREIDMTFEELLRTHEDEIKSLLLERMIK